MIKKGIFFKFTLFISTLLSVILLFYSLRSYNTEKSILQKAKREEVIKLAKAIAISSTEFVATYDFGTLEAVIKDIMEDEDIVYVRITDKNGKVLLADNPQIENSYLKGPIDIKAQKEAVSIFFPLVQKYHDKKIGEDIYDVAIPIRSEAKIWGIVRIGYSLKSQKEIMKKHQIRLFIISLLFVLLGVVSSLFLSRILTKPIIYLSDISRKIKERGDLSLRSQLKTGDELQILSDGFNDMLSSLQQTMDEIRDRNVELSILHNFSGKLLSTIHTQEIGKIVFDEIYNLFEPNKLAVLYHDPFRNYLRVLHQENYDKEMVEILKYLHNMIDFEKKGDIFVKEENIIIPLSQQNRIIGIICLNVKDKDKFIKNMDMPFTTAFFNQISTSFNNARLYEQAITDGLTGLYIHRYFHLKLEEEFRKCKREGKSLSLIMTDIDFFKKVNDTYGHQIGDEVLRTVAGVLQKNVRGGDIVCRYGGEEMAIILPETDLSEAGIVAERLRTKIMELSFESEKGQFKITSSFGVSSYDAQLKNKDELIERADRCLYKAKEQGRNRVVLFSIKKYRVTIPYRETPPQHQDKIYEVHFDVEAGDEFDAKKEGIKNFYRFYDYTLASWIRIMDEENIKIEPI